jgi:hypothetical protein
MDPGRPATTARIGLRKARCRIYLAGYSRKSVHPLNSLIVIAMELRPLPLGFLDVPLSRLFPGLTLSFSAVKAWLLSSPAVAAEGPGLYLSEPPLPSSMRL